MLQTHSYHYIKWAEFKIFLLTSTEARLFIPPDTKKYWLDGSLTSCTTSRSLPNLSTSTPSAIHPPYKKVHFMLSIYSLEHSHISSIQVPEEEWIFLCLHLHQKLSAEESLSMSGAGTGLTLPWGMGPALHSLWLLAPALSWVTGWFYLGQPGCPFFLVLFFIMLQVLALDRTMRWEK